VTPGEKLSVIEAFESGEGTFVDDGTVRALRVGRAVPNRDKRRISVKPIRNMGRVPRPGDIVVGIVETAQPSVANILIETINDKYSQSGFTGMLYSGANRSQRGRGRRRVTCKPGDIVRARVYSVKNSIFHISVDLPEEGVLRTVCSICGGVVVRIGDRVKCIECSYVEERKLASDFDQHLIPE
jgi:exosome complex component CSL4